MLNFFLSFTSSKLIGLFLFSAILDQEAAFVLIDDLRAMKSELLGLTYIQHHTVNHSPKPCGSEPGWRPTANQVDCMWKKCKKFKAMNGVHDTVPTGWFDEFTRNLLIALHNIPSLSIYSVVKNLKRGTYFMRKRIKLRANIQLKCKKNLSKFFEGSIVNIQVSSDILHQKIATDLNSCFDWRQVSSAIVGHIFRPQDNSHSCVRLQQLTHETILQKSSRTKVLPLHLTTALAGQGSEVISWSYVESEATLSFNFYFKSQQGNWSGINN